MQSPSSNLTHFRACADSQQKPSTTRATLPSPSQSKALIVLTPNEMLIEILCSMPLITRWRQYPGQSPREALYTRILAAFRVASVGICTFSLESCNPKLHLDHRMVHKKLPPFLPCLPSTVPSSLRGNEGRWQFD
jgi:hypothetical protein